LKRALNLGDGPVALGLTETAIDVAWGRSGGRDLGDAVHIATARRGGATCFITNDARVRGRAPVEIVRLGDIEIEGTVRAGA